MKLYLMLFALSGLRLVRSHCNLPPQQDIDWTRVKGKWYNILNDPTVQDKFRFCSEIALTGNPNGIVDFVWTIPNEHGEMEPLRGQGIPDGHGHYVDISGHENWPAARDYIMNSLKNGYVTVDASDDWDAHFGTMIFDTDYDHYFMVIECAKPSGRSDIYIFDKNPNPTIDDILRITNRLDEIGHGWEKIELSYRSCPGRK